MKRTSVSIGIPAYNEEANIKQLLTLLLFQSASDFTLEKIYVVSDGSTDKTAAEVAKIKDPRIYFSDDKKRLGKSARLNEILKLNTSDVLILMDADVVFNDNNLLSKLIKQVDFTTIGIAAINACPLPPNTFFERVLDTSVSMVKDIAQRWNNGNNYLSFKGCFLALSGKYASTVRLPKQLTNNDAYLYFAAKKAGFGAVFVNDCYVYYKSPITLGDHIKQSSRFQQSKDELQKYFSKKELSYAPQKSLVLLSMGRMFVKQPIPFLAYLGIHAIAKLRMQKLTNPTWRIASSTKQKIALTH